MASFIYETSKPVLDNLCFQNYDFLEEYLLNLFPGLTVGVSDTVTTPVQSLNGNGCEFKDGTAVNVEGRTGVIYTVLSSSFFLLDDSSYTVLYDLNSPTGETLKCPESLLTRYIEVSG